MTTASCLIVDAKEQEIPNLNTSLPFSPITYVCHSDLEEQIQKCNDYAVLIIQSNNFVDETLLASLPHLKSIITRSSGTDHIVASATANRDIKVYHLTDYSTTSVAEFTMMSLLNLAKKIKLIEGRFQLTENEFGKCVGVDLKDRTLGIIGTGKIGKEVAKRAKVFGMNVLAHSRTIDRDFEENQGIKYVPLNDLLNQSDFVTLHTSLTYETYHLINQETIKQMKEGAILINTSRGSVVDTKALIEALKSEKISQCALDVIEEEYTKEPYFYWNAKVIITPHFASGTVDALDRHFKETIQVANQAVKDL